MGGWISSSLFLASRDAENSIIHELIVAIEFDKVNPALKLCEAWSSISPGRPTATTAVNYTRPRQ